MKRAREAAVDPDVSSSTMVAALSTSASSMIVQFQSVEESSAPSVSVDVPLDVTTAQLNILLGKLLSTNDVPYAFYVNDEEIIGTLRESIDAQKLSAESVQRIRYQPLSVYKVLPVTRCTDSLPGHTEAVLHVSFSPNGRVLASGGGDTMVRFWDVLTCTPKATCKGHSHHVLCTAWSPDGRLFASADKAGEVRVWDAATGKPACQPMAGHKSWITSLAWEPLHRVVDPSNQCTLLASAGKDGTVRVWDTRSGACRFVISGHTDSIESVKWGGQGLIYTASRDRIIMVWAVAEDRNSAKLVRTLAGHGHRINSLALNTDYLTRTGALEPSTGPVGASTVAALAPEAAVAAAKTRYSKHLSQMGGQEVLVSCSDDFTLFLWHPENDKKSVIRMTGHQQPVNHISFSPDGRYIASASFDRKVKLWDGRTGKFITTYQGHVGSCYQVCWSADSRLLASASKDSTVKVWSSRVGHADGPAKPNALHTLPGHADEVFALDWSPMGDIMASGGRDRVIKL